MSTKNLDNGRITFEAQSAQTSFAHDLREEMVQKRIELGLVLKHVSGGAEEVNVVNYLSKPPPQNDEYYCDEDSCAGNYQIGGFRLNAQGSNKENLRQGHVNHGRNNCSYNRNGHYVRHGNYNCDNFNQGNYGNKNYRSVPYFPPQNSEVAPRDGGRSMARVEHMIHKMMMRFDASNEHTKELRNDFASAG